MQLTQQLLKEGFFRHFFQSGARKLLVDSDFRCDLEPPASGCIEGLGWNWLCTTPGILQSLSPHHFRKITSTTIGEPLSLVGGGEMGIPAGSPSLLATARRTRLFLASIVVVESISK
jgi:hypothetical protein